MKLHNKNDYISVYLVMGFTAEGQLGLDRVRLCVQYSTVPLQYSTAEP
jgi:hypothetical protein